VADVDPAAIRARVATRDQTRAYVQNLLTAGHRSAAADAAATATGLEAELGRDVPALLALVDEQAARIDKSVPARDLFDALAQRRTALVRLAAVEARMAELEAQQAAAKDEFRVEFRAGTWVRRIAVVGSWDAAMERVHRAAVEEPDVDCVVVRVRTSKAVVWPPEGAGPEKPPEAAQEPVSHPGTREEPVSPA
jgi:hypothetical protein